MVKIAPAICQIFVLSHRSPYGDIVTQVSSKDVNISFTNTGADYFRIWFLFPQNLLFCLINLTYGFLVLSRVQRCAQKWNYLSTTGESPISARRLYGGRCQPSPGSTGSDCTFSARSWYMYWRRFGTIQGYHRHRLGKPRFFFKKIIILTIFLNSK